MAEMHVGHSPLTNNIYAGKLAKNRKVWAGGKSDVTLEALCAVAEHVIQFGKPVEVTDTEGHLIYRIIVEKPS